MLELNFTVQDILSAFWGFLIFPCVLIAPGYVTGWFFDLFDFKRRRPLVRLGIGLVLSFAVSPIIFQLTSNLISFGIAIILVAVFTLICIFLVIHNGLIFEPNTGIFLWVGVGWVCFAILSLINIQWGDQLFYSVTSYDQTTRVSVIDAITRTGVPPMNPGYYPGEPVKLTFIYYFWYVICSMVDVLGGKYVDARASLNASSAWIGLGLMAVIALYFRMRNMLRLEVVWKSVQLGVAFLAISGLDVLPAVFLMIRTEKMIGSIDVWNTWIQSWVASALWVPHHLASLLAGMCAILLLHYARGKSQTRQFTILAVAGLSFASAFGLSVYVALVFVVFWGIWLGMLFIKREDNSSLILPMISSGVIALIISAPFLVGLFQGGGSGDSGVGLPIVFEIRTLLQLESFVEDWSPLTRSLIMLAVLPINYLFELGFFLISALYWFKIKDKTIRASNHFFSAEIILFFVVLFIASTMRSTLIASNDLGWRAWLPGQFVLLIWGVDVFENLFSASNSSDPIQCREVVKNRRLMLLFIGMGALTTVVDAVLLRTAWPVMTGPEVPRQYYSARFAYEYLRENVPSTYVVQNNPLSFVDRPSGLYASHQMIVSDRTAYGVPQNDFEILTEKVSRIFTSTNVSEWNSIDGLCKTYKIKILIFTDVDPVWESLSTLKIQRQALYENQHYAVFVCGDQ